MATLRIATILFVCLLFLPAFDSSVRAAGSPMITGDATPESPCGV